MSLERSIINALLHGTREEQDSLLTLIELECGILARLEWERVLNDCGFRK